jgi:hypothetical protein
LPIILSIAKIHHHPSSGAGTISEIVADVPRGLSPIPPTPRVLKKSTLPNAIPAWSQNKRCNLQMMGSISECANALLETPVNSVNVTAAKSAVVAEG